MSISAVGGISPQTFQSIVRAATPEAAEVAGAHDHDGDSDDRARAAAPAGGARRGSVNVLA
jgi:hypothetical protein